MFKICSKINNVCAFCTKDKWNPHLEDYDDKERLFCGFASGFDTRVEALDVCWKVMSKAKRSSFVKKKREEYQVIINDRR